MGLCEESEKFVEPTEQHLPKGIDPGFCQQIPSSIPDELRVTEQVEAEKNIQSNMMDAELPRGSVPFPSTQNQVDLANPVSIERQSAERTSREGQEDLGTFPEMLLIRMDNGLNIPYKIAECYESQRYHMHHLVGSQVETIKIKADAFDLANPDEAELEDPIEPDMVNHPEHYQGAGGMEVIDVIEAFTDDLYGIEAVCQGNAIKYLLRWFKKNGIEDLDKLVWYINKLKASVLKHEAEGKYSCPCGG